MPEVPEEGKLWFERVYAYLHLPFWAGALLFGLGPLSSISLVVSYLLTLWEVPLATEEVFSAGILYAILVVWAPYAARSARRGIEAMEHDTRPMRQGKPLNLGPLYSVGFALLTWAVLEAITIPLYLFSVFPQDITLDQRLVFSFSYMYIDFVAYTLLWVLFYSLYTIYKVGRLELDLKHFSEDRSLGLNPVGRLTLKLTGLYVIFLVLELVPDVLAGNLAGPMLILLGAVVAMAFAFFFLPLLPLRRQLQREKRKLSERLAPRFVRLYGEIETNPENEVGQKAVNELMVLQAMKRDIEQIHNWPFDTGVVVRLSVIVFSVTAIILSRVISLVLGV